MPTKSREKFTENSKDVERLLEIHTAVAGDAKGRKWGVEVLNKSAVIQVCAVWEAYVEDLLHEAIDHLSLNLTDPSKLPLTLRKLIAKQVREDKNELSPWELAGTGWQLVLAKNIKALKSSFTSGWNTPKSHPVKELFEKGLGLSDVTTAWKRTTLTVAKARKKLDDYVSLRGDIAHRSKALTSVTKDHSSEFLEHVKRLVEFTDAAVNEHVKTITGSGLF